MRSVARLKVPTRKKFSIAGIFLLAYAGFGASLARTVLYFRLVLHPGNHDLGLYGTEVAYLTMLEAGLSTIAVNLPTLWYLVSSSESKDMAQSSRGIASLNLMRSKKPSTPESPKLGPFMSTVQAIDIEDHAGGHA